jgi:hypothetical protein
MVPDASQEIHHDSTRHQRRSPACGLASNTLAHEFWIQPAKFHIRRGEPIGVALMVGDGFSGEPVSPGATRGSDATAPAAGKPNDPSSAAADQ